MKKVNFIQMKDGTKEEYLFLDKHEQEIYSKATADRILKFMNGLTNQYFRRLPNNKIRNTHYKLPQEH